jgi:hypothetical protein
VTRTSTVTSRSRGYPEIAPEPERAATSVHAAVGPGDSREHADEDDEDDDDGPDSSGPAWPLCRRRGRRNAAAVAVSRAATTPPTPRSSWPTSHDQDSGDESDEIPGDEDGAGGDARIVGGVVGGAASPAPGTTATAVRPRTIHRTPSFTSGRLGGTRPPTRTAATARSRASTGRRGWRPSGNAAGTAATPAAAGRRS